MTNTYRVLTALLALALSTAHVQAGQFVVELSAPLDSTAANQVESNRVELQHTFSAGADSYAVFSAADQPALEQYLNETKIKAEKVTAVRFINSPSVGGGKVAGTAPRKGHQTFVIERSIPGIGSLPIEKQREISKGSNAANMKLGNVIEWDHSYLTDEGTYCVYRATSSEKVREQGELSGAPISKITAVEQRSF